MELTLARAAVQRFADAHGMDLLMAALEMCSGRELELYSVSTEWQWIPGLALRARGARGDLLVRLT